MSGCIRNILFALALFIAGAIGIHYLTGMDKIEHHVEIRKPTKEEMASIRAQKMYERELRNQYQSKPIEDNRPKRFIGYSSDDGKKLHQVKSCAGKGAYEVYVVEGGDRYSRCSKCW